MSSGYPGGVPDFFSGGRTPTALHTSMNGAVSSYNANLNTQQHQPFSFRAPIAPDPAAQIRRPDSIGKRSLAEFQHQSQGLGFYLRNMKPRHGNCYYPQHASPISTLSPVDFSPVPSDSSDFPSINQRYGLPIAQRVHPGNYSGRRGFVVGNSGPEISARDQTERNMIMSDKLQELEKQLLGDDDDESEPVSAVTNSEWSDTIQNLLGPARKPTAISPSSSSSSCSSTSASPPLTSAKQALIDASEAISDGKPDIAAELLTRLHQQSANARGTSEQRLAAYMIAALRPRVSPTHPSPPAAELGGTDHAAATQMLYDVSPCFKLGFMAANLAILEATAEKGFEKIHVIDFDIGQGGQYVHLLHALSKSREGASLTITAGEDKLKGVREGLDALANRVGVLLTLNAVDPNTTDLTRENLKIRPGEALAVNFAFKLYNLPDESVSTENLRDETLRRVKSLSPEVMTVVEQEMNTNTATLASRVRDAWEYYGLLFDSLDSTVSRDSPERVRIEEGLGRKISNAVGCEGVDRVERCEVYGKWRARMSMAGFKLRPVSKVMVDSLRVKVNSGTRGNPGFSVSEESGGIGFGWMGRNLTVASAWS